MRRATLHRTSSAIAFTALVAVLLLCLSSVALAELTPQPVRVAKAMEWKPAASADYLAWTRGFFPMTGHQGVWAMAYGQEPFRVNPKGVNGEVGGIDGTTLVYTEDNGANSDIFFFDLGTKVQTEAPGRINTAKWECEPSISGDWVLFGRLNGATGARKVLLYNTATDELRTLGETSGWRHWVDAGQVNGNYAVWVKGSGSTSNVFLYDIAADATTQIPNPGDKAQYAASATPAGTVFYGRSGFACGQDVVLTAYPIGGPAETLVSFGSGWDLHTSYALDNGDGTTDVFYDPGPCSGKSDIYKVTYS
jgi:hypothetical protein